jgi:leucyl-tRNA synthetase
VVRKNLTQWFFRITDYAQELLDGLDQLDWPEKTKKIQINWIGRSEGAEIVFGAQKNGQPVIDESGQTIQLPVFTTRADTLMGVTYVVVAPESDVCRLLTTDERRNEVEQYQSTTSRVSDIDRMSSVREKTGVFTGSYFIFPLTGEKLPIWTSDYVIAGLEQGLSWLLPAHDERDFEFATQFDLPIPACDSFISDQSLMICRLPIKGF